MKRWGLLIITALLAMVGWGALAQDAIPEPIIGRVELTLSDGQVLVGDIHTPSEIPEGGAPALLLMHQNRDTRASWEPILPLLVDAGYVVLAVDLRGHGETGGVVNWTLAQEDTIAWFIYLESSESVNPAKIGVMGSSIGSNLALVGCAAYEACITAIAISPGLNYFGVQPEAVVTGTEYRNRTVLLLASRSDGESGVAVRKMAGGAGGEMGLRVYDGSTHGTALFDSDYEVEALILLWLSEAFSAE